MPLRDEQADEQWRKGKLVMLCEGKKEAREKPNSD
jgi:hypothetical protein